MNFHHTYMGLGVSIMPREYQQMQSNSKMKGLCIIPPYGGSRSKVLLNGNFLCFQRTNEGGED